MQLAQQTRTRSATTHDVYLDLQLTNAGPILSSTDTDLLVEGSIITYKLAAENRLDLVRFMFPTPVDDYAVTLQINSVLPTGTGTFTNTTATLPIDTSVEATLVFTPPPTSTATEPPLNVTIRTRQKGGGR